MKIAFQGEPGAYSEAAAKNLFGDSHRFIPCEYFEEVFSKVKSGQVSRGVVPIENSLAGSIHQNYDLLQQYQLKIISETQLRVEHVLMCHPNTQLKNIREVRSHPQALAQCSQFLRRRKSIKAQAWYDTAGAAKYLSQNALPDIAAIASIYAAEIYGLKVLRRNLENNHANYTRFLGISNREFRVPKGVPSKTSLSITPRKNHSGILFQMLEVFASHGIDLLKIESRPVPRRVFEYLFYVDFAGNATDPSVKTALGKLKKMCSRLEVFGSYKVGEKSFFK